MEYRNGLVYLARNKVDGKVYVGATIKTLDARRKFHMKVGMKKSDSLFYQAIRAFGEDAFEWSILEDAIPESQLASRERFYIEKMRAFCDFEDSNGYNEEFDGRRSMRFVRKRSAHHLDGRTIFCPEADRTFASIREAAEFAGVSRSAIKQILDGSNFRTRSGYHFEYRGSQ